MDTRTDWAKVKAYNTDSRRGKVSEYTHRCGHTGLFCVCVCLRGTESRATQSCN